MYKVLIVDDMEVMRRDIKRQKVWGERTGFEVCAEAQNGYEALKILESRPVDMVITDIKMPIVDGVELLQKITERKLAQCVVFYSEYSEFTYARQGLVYGVFDYVIKPIKEEELLALLHRAKQYIEQKKLEQNKIKELEDRLEQKMEMLFPLDEVTHIIKLICQGNQEFYSAVESLVHTVVGAFDNDLVKVKIVIKKAVEEIKRAVMEEYGWIELMTDTSNLTEDDFIKNLDVECIISSVLSFVEKIASPVQRFICENESNSTVRKINEYILKNVENELSLKSISQQFYLNRSYVSGMFRQKTGMTVGEYITMAKMERAMRLMEEYDLKSYEIADKLKYKDIEYFGRLFKKYTGLSPNEYRRKYSDKK